jgi:beta-lactamase superfamily II metal-dependent hydrolase
MAVFIIMVIITGCTDSDPGNSPADKTTVEQDDSLPEQQEEHQPETSLSTESSSSDKQEAAEEKPDDSGTLKVHFVDVGQADSILIQLSSCQNILIDGGNNDDGTLVVNYLK